MSAYLACPGLAGIQRDALQECFPFFFIQQAAHVECAAQPGCNSPAKWCVHVLEGIFDYIERHAFVKTLHIVSPRIEFRHFRYVLLRCSCGKGFSRLPASSMYTDTRPTEWFHAATGDLDATGTTITAAAGQNRQPVLAQSGAGSYGTIAVLPASYN